LGVQHATDVCLLKDNSGQTTWHKAALRGDVEVLKKLWDWAKELYQKSVDLRNELLFSNDKSRLSTWLKKSGKYILEKLWEWAKSLELKPEGLRNEVLLSKKQVRTNGLAHRSKQRLL